MSKTLRDVVSELATDLKGANLDDRTSFRFLSNKFIDQLDYFLHQETRSREFMKRQNLWQPIDCVELIDVPTNACGMIDTCNTLKRSKNKLPKLIDTAFGLLVKVFTIDGLIKYTSVLSQDYKDYINREYGPRDIRTFYLENDYIYIPNTDIVAVKVLVVSKDFCKVEVLNGQLTSCASPLDCTLSYPDYLIAITKQAVLKELLSGYKNVPEDEKGDDNTNSRN